MSSPYNNSKSRGSRKFRSIQRLLKQEACGRLVVLIFFTCAFLSIGLIHLPLLPLLTTDFSNITATKLLRRPDNAAQQLPKSNTKQISGGISQSFVNSWFQTAAPPKDINMPSVQVLCSGSSSTQKANIAVNHIHAYLFAGTHASTVDPTLNLRDCAPTTLLQSCPTLIKMWNSLFSSNALSHVGVTSVKEFTTNIVRYHENNNDNNNNDNKADLDDEYLFFQDDREHAFTLQGTSHFKPLGILSLYFDLFGLPSKLSGVEVLNVGDGSLPLLFAAMGAAKVTTIQGKRCAMMRYISSSFGLSVQDKDCEQDIYDIISLPSPEYQEQYYQRFDLVTARLLTVNILTLRILYNFLKPGGVLLLDTSSIARTDDEFDMFARWGNDGLLPEPKLLQEWMKAVRFEQVSTTSSTVGRGNGPLEKDAREHVVAMGRKVKYQIVPSTYQYTKGWPKGVC